MKHLLPLPEQILANFPDVEGSPHFRRDELWLTFYLWGEPANLERLVIVLQHEGWVNTGGSEGSNSDLGECLKRVESGLIYARSR